jgi:hypothetical protein
VPAAAGERVLPQHVFCVLRISSGDLLHLLLLLLQTFWDHEWNRHGTCAAPVLGDQHRFFGTVLSLHHKLNIQVSFF